MPNSPTIGDIAKEQLDKFIAGNESALDECSPTVLKAMVEVSVKRHMRDVFKLVRQVENLRSALHGVAGAFQRIHDVLTPGMKAGVPEAKGVAREGMEAARSAAKREDDNDGDTNPS